MPSIHKALSKAPKEGTTRTRKAWTSVVALLHVEESFDNWINLLAERLTTPVLSKVKYLSVKPSPDKDSATVEYKWVRVVSSAEKQYLYHYGESGYSRGVATALGVLYDKLRKSKTPILFRLANGGFLVARWEYVESGEADKPGSHVIVFEHAYLCEIHSIVPEVDEDQMVAN